MPRVDEGYLQLRRRQIMDAAITCFAREGFHRATMQDIVRETGLSAGAIYRYFRSKEDIVAAIAAEHHAAEAAAFAEASTGTGDVVAALRRLAHASLDRLAGPAEQRWRRVTVQVWGEALRSERIMGIVRGGLDEPVRILAALIRRGQRDGTLPHGLDPEGAARVCASIFQGLVLQQAWDPGLDVDAYVASVLALIEALAESARQQDGAAPGGRAADPGIAKV